MTYRSTGKSTGHRMYATINGVFKKCPRKEACAKSQSVRMVGRVPFEEIRPIVQRRYESPEGQAVYAKRQQKVEHPFGHLKRNLGVQSFLLRGLAGVRAEAALMSSCFNIARMMTLVGIATLLPTLRAA